MTVKLLTEHHLEFQSFTGGCRGSSEYTLVKLPHCWKSHVVAQILINASDICVPSVDNLCKQGSGMPGYK